MKKKLTLAGIMQAVNPSPKILTWYGIYNDNNKARLDAIPNAFWKTIDRVNIAFGKLIQGDKGFSVDFDGDPQNVKDLIDRVKPLKPEMEFYLTVGGDGTSASFGGAALDPNFGENVANFLSDNGLSGFDNDWENSIDRDLLLKVSETLYKALSQRKMGSTLCVWPENGGQYDPKLQEFIDFLMIMSYGPDCDPDECLKSYVAVGFLLHKLALAIETESTYPEGGPDTLGKEGSVDLKAQRTLEPQEGSPESLAAAGSWNINNDSCTDATPSIPTCERGIALSQALLNPSSKGKASPLTPEKEKLHKAAVANFKGPYTRYKEWVNSLASKKVVHIPAKNNLGFWYFELGDKEVPA